MRGLHSIHHRLFVLVLFCMAGIVLIVSLLYYNRTARHVQEQASDLSQKNIAQTATLFDLLLDSYDSMSKSIIGNVDLVRLVRQQSYGQPEVDYINIQAVTNILGAVYLSRDDLVGIHVVADHGRIYNYGNYMNAIDLSYKETDWYSRVEQSSGDMVWLGVYPRSIIDRVEERPVFAFARKIYDLNMHEPIGFVLFEADPRTILGAMANLKLGPSSEVYLLSGEGRIVSAASADPAAMPDAATLPRPDTVQEPIVERSGEWLTVASKLPVADWIVVSRTPSSELGVDLAETQRYLLLVVVALILAATLVATLVSRTIASPLKRLIREMKRVELGDFRGQVNVTSYQEINLLVKSFNQMVERIAELIEQVKISSVSEKNAELHALQSQVNPHFLYNTLDMIYWMLDEQENEKLGNVVLSLSHLFRYSSHWDEGAQVTLREEAEQIHHYLTIILTRLEGRLTVDIELDERWMNIRLPKMTLQPIIENAVKHGLEPLNRPGLRLKVFTHAEERNLTIMIEDNGVGMDTVTLKRLRDSLSAAGETAAGYEAGPNAADGGAGSGDEAGRGSRAGKGGGIGLSNLQRRLRHMHGESSGVEVMSKLGGGTAVVVIIPLKAKEEGSGHANLNYR